LSLILKLPIGNYVFEKIAVLAIFFNRRRQINLQLIRIRIKYESSGKYLFKNYFPIMPKPHFCHTCTFYEKNIFTRTGESFGICHNVAVATKLAIDGKTVLGDDGIIYTEEYFGCIYWRENDGTLIDTSKFSKDKLREIVCKTCGACNPGLNILCIKCQYPL